MQVATGTGTEPLTSDDIQIWKDMMGRTPKGVAQPNFAKMIPFLMAEELNGNIADEWRSLHRVISFLHILLPGERERLPLLKNIDEARNYLRKKIIPDKTASPTFDYYNDIIIDLLINRNKAMLPIHRAGVFAACYAQSKIPNWGWFFNSFMGSTINAVMNAIEKHLRKKVKDYSAFATDIEAYVETYKEPIADVNPSMANIKKATVSFEST